MKRHKHLLTKHPMYKAWTAMRQRCTNPNDRAYKNYGALGVVVCARWDNFALFLADVGERPKGMTLDRVKADGNYEPDNVRWATKAEQQRNQRLSRVNTTGHTGVSWDKARRKYKAHITVDNKNVELGRFARLNDAVTARRTAEQELW